MAVASIIVDLAGIAVTTVSIAQSLFGMEDGTNNKIRVRAALNGPKKDENGNDVGTLGDAGGDFPDVRIFNENLEFLGISADAGYVSDGGFKDVSISQSVNQQPTFALFTANNDAICLAYITSTWPDGDKYAWVGNWGSQCGTDYFYSDVYVQQEDGSSRELQCMWIDGDGNHPVTAFHVHWPEFNSKPGNQPNGDPNYVCNQVRPFNFQYTNDPNTIYTKRSLEDTSPLDLGDARPPVKKSSKRGNLVPDNRLVQSSRPSQSAAALCAAENSRGPDFVNLAEGVYCDMATKTAYPICKGLLDAVEGHCFDMSLKATTAFSDILTLKNFTQIMDWGTGKQE